MSTHPKRISRVHYIQHDMNARHDRKIAIAAAALTEAFYVDRENPRIEIEVKEVE